MVYGHCLACCHLQGGPVKSQPDIQNAAVSSEQRNGLTCSNVYFTHPTSASCDVVSVPIFTCGTLVSVGISCRCVSVTSRCSTETAKDSSFCVLKILAKLKRGHPQ